MSKPAIGTRYGLLTVMERSVGAPRYFLCRCDCGSEKLIRCDHLVGGKTISCGCEHARRASARAHVMHAANTKHGACRSSMYNRWHAIRRRCTVESAPAYQNYGARGIYVCERWRQSFEAFRDDMGEPPPGATLERVDNDGPYSPENCRWATRAEQASNRRVNKVVTWQGKTLNLSQWSRETGIHRNTLDKRYDKGFRGAELFAAPHEERTHCRHGHLLSEVGFYVCKSQAICMGCHRERIRRASAKRTARRNAEKAAREAGRPT